jgi:hypothetical protein
MKHKTVKKAKPSPSDIIARLQSNRLYLDTIDMFTAATDEELHEYASACAATLGVLVSWAKRATFGLASMDDLKTLFFGPATPDKVKAFFERAMNLTMGKEDGDESSN